MRKTSGATPLAALDAVALDTETTGLDAAAARIVQLGAVAVAAGTVSRDDSFKMLVDPRIAIPGAATRIHGITNAMVRDAPAWPRAAEALGAYVAGRVVIGYSIGFDLAVMAAEAERAGIVFDKPRTLCVRLLATVAGARLPDNSLDTIAAWLGVAVEGRHSALGDAIAAADIFVALLPKLAGRGVRTLAEAERACLMLTGELDQHHRAGWAEPVSPPDRFAGRKALGAVDPFAYRHRIGELMSAPPVVARESDTLRNAIALMVGRGIGALLVSADGEPGALLSAYAIVTERDIMRRIAASGADAFALPLGEIANRPVKSIRAAAFAYRAIGRMDRLKVRHLAVRDEDGRLVGIVSARDLLRLRAGAAISLDDDIELAADAEAMAAAWATLPAVARGLIDEEIDARTIAEIVSEELRGLTRRATAIAEAAMLAEGHGAPPCPYAVMVLGSAGRGESLLAPDQDNAIVFAEGEPGGREDLWFATLGDKIATMLDTAGVPFCTGGVMAKNAEWRGSSATWGERIAGWIARSRPEDLLNVDIFFDMVAVAGKARLAGGLFDLAYELGSRHTEFAKLLGERLFARSSPFTLLGGFHTEEGRLDLKMFGLFPAVAFARALAIRHDIRQHSTRARLKTLIGHRIGSEADLNRVIRAHALMMRLLLAQQSRDLLAGIPATNRVETAALSRDEQAELKAALKIMQIVPDLARDLMFG